MIGIYCLTNKVNNKKYFGQSTNIERREKEYFNYRGFPNEHLKNAFNKYGKENFDFKIIKCCKEKYLDRFEKLYIRINDTINPDKGYNKDTGGNLNKHHSPETIKKMSEAQSGENNHFYGQKHTPEAHKKMIENHARYWEGKTFSEKHKKKISESNKGKRSSNYGKRGDKSHSWKNYPRIVKHSKDKRGKRRYKIVYNGKVFATSFYKEKLYKKWYDEYSDIELIDETNKKN